jgi:hypothetical protein
MTSTKSSLLFLTNLYNGSAEEDIYLTEKLRAWFNISIVHPLDSESIEDTFKIALIRNIWPSHEYENQKTRLIRRLIQKGLMPMSEAERGYQEHEHYLEKGYLLDLYEKGYPVIPTVDTIANIERLGNCQEYFIKPKNMCDGEGSEKLTKEALEKKVLHDYLIQPFITFDYEVCFYFIDGKFVYAFSTPNRLEGKMHEEYIPIDADFEFAQKFVYWNNLQFGLQRVDALRVTETQELLLTELEDFGPYLYLLELPETVREKAVSALAASLLKRI